MEHWSNAVMVVAKYSMIFIMAFYVFYSFTRAFVKTGSFQKILVYLFHFTGTVVIFLHFPTDSVLLFYGGQLLYLIFILQIIPVLYDSLQGALLNHIAMLVSIGFLILHRLDLTMDDSKAFRQFLFLCAGTLVFSLIPYCYRKVRRPERFGWGFFVVGFGLLVIVMVAGAVTMGAKLSISIGPVTIQPSEFVKITYVLFLASYLSKHANGKYIIFSAVLAGVHMLVLLLSTDLGAMLIFGVTYLVMLYCATGKKRYLGGGMLIGLCGSVLAFLIFSHVQERVQAWLDPWSVIDDVGYQITQSLFAIGTGGFIGSGLFGGSPEDIPVVYKDFIFSAISEEFGGFFGLLLILLYFNFFLSMIIIGMRQTRQFAKLSVCGFAALLGTQVFLSIGGNIKMIPSTGVTLPLISYGGSSLVSVILMLGIVMAMEWTNDLDKKGGAV